jgi:hypothetical protein
MDYCEFDTLIVTVIDSPPADTTPPVITHNLDPEPTITSDAPASYPVGSCRQLDLKLTDGTTHSAFFKFK